MRGEGWDVRDEDVDLKGLGGRLAQNITPTSQTWYNTNNKSLRG